MGRSEDQEDTPLHEAVRYSDIPDVKAALKKGCDPNKIGLYQWSALHEAANNGDAHIIKLLLKYGGDPNKPDLLQECTALHYAASQGHLQCLHLLLDAGGKWDVSDMNEKTCLDVATGECVSVLRKLKYSNENHTSTNNNGCKNMSSLQQKQEGKGLSWKSGVDSCSRKITYLFQRFKNNLALEDILDTNNGDKELLTRCCSRENLEKVILENTQPEFIKGKEDNPEMTSQEDLGSTSDIYSMEENRISRKSSDTSSVIKSDSLSEFDSALDPDVVSLTSLDSLDNSLYSTSVITPHAWTHDGPVVGVGRKLILGHIVLSFEYNSKKSTLKIRVWQVSDLLMPPVETSMISGIYAKSYLMPDKRKNTKRKTEELPVYKPADKIKKQSDTKSMSEIFKPSSFSFKKAPEYKNITPRMVKERMVHIEVCTVQKYTRRSFVLATFNIPLAEAVKKLVKQRYPLTPRISTELPDNMKVYDGSDLKISHQRSYKSYPNSRASSASSLPHRGRDRSSSDTNLKSVMVEDARKSSSIEIRVPPEGDDVDELEQQLHQIKIMEQNEQVEKWTSISMTVVDSDDELNTSFPDGKKIVHCDVHEVKVHSPNTKEITQSYSNPVFEGKTTKLDEEKKKRRSRRFSLRKPSISKGFKREKEKFKSKRHSISSISQNEIFRSETPTFLWDDYMEPLQTTLEPVTFDDDFGFEMDGPVLPMVTSMDMPRVHGNSFSRGDRIKTTSFTENSQKSCAQSFSIDKSNRKKSNSVLLNNNNSQAVNQALPSLVEKVSIFRTEPEGDHDLSEPQTLVTPFVGDDLHNSAINIPEDTTVDIVNEVRPYVKVSPKSSHLPRWKSASGSQYASKYGDSRRKISAIEMAKMHTTPRLGIETDDDFILEGDFETRLL